jgi:hypothetical protein
MGVWIIERKCKNKMRIHEYLIIIDLLVTVVELYTHNSKLESSNAAKGSREKFNLAETEMRDWIILEKCEKVGK